MVAQARCALAWAGLALAAGAWGRERVTLSLDGEWQIEDSVAADAMPREWHHRVPVPGLAHLAQPAFADVDQFDSQEVIANRIEKGKLPESARVSGAGVSRQHRNYFWYARTFRVNARRQVAILRINKAQFGTAVWLNGQKIGEHAGCFSAGYFDVTRAIDWDGDNRLVVRIGAHPGVLPADYPTGTDFEKNRWTPGIYDSVALLASDNPVIESVQVAPHIADSQVTAQTRLKNYGTSRVRVVLGQSVREWRRTGDGRQVSRAAPLQIELAPGEENTWTQTIAIPAAELWAPEHPFLYVLETSTGGDSTATRFGMREFRFDTPTRRAYLNGRIYFLRGSNITLHRFFEDPLSGALPWNDAWLRKLLIEIPKQMNWNAFRFCIGPVPEKWLDIADEAGLLIQNEFPVWTGAPDWFHAKYKRSWNADEMIRQYGEWMRDNWNHPSVAIWDANNETLDPLFAEKIIPAVRGLDLSARPWENSYNQTVGPDDPVEDHPYLFQKGSEKDETPFETAEIEGMSGKGRAGTTPTAHAQIDNEYGWLWLLRDGTPTELTGKVYDHLLGANASPQDRLELDAYLLGGLTEFWRAYRSYAGVLHFVYLTACYPGAYTCDNFQDVAALKLEPHFADYMREAFKPLGVYLDFWQPTLAPGSSRRIAVMMVNDAYEPARGKLLLTLEGGGGTPLARREVPFAVPGLGQQTYAMDLQVPQNSGPCILKAAAYADGQPEPTVSRRKVTIQASSQ
ncbi:MAG TPA: glycoside hydrolase family 2 TIM barrel-domain containing protein [Bryobacteraceae bacterium]|nr:glycoside hydrolase family 2 TIM barrel-domain containing protein [Bryobacteraceae bacterium]